jgi:hypothetical protein
MSLLSVAIYLTPANLTSIAIHNELTLMIDALATSCGHHQKSSWMASLHEVELCMLSILDTNDGDGESAVQATD